MPGEEFRPGERAPESEPLCHGKRPPRSAKQHLAGPVEPQLATAKYQEAVESALVGSPVPYRPGVDADKTRLRILADTAALHRRGFRHRIAKLRFEANVERAARDMLPVLGDAKRSSGRARLTSSCLTKIARSLPSSRSAGQEAGAERASQPGLLIEL